MTDLTPVFEALIALAAALITAFVIPWVKKKTAGQDREAMLAWVDIAVAAAQQLYHDLDGAKRKAYVVEFLSERGYSVCDTALDAAIEAAVLRLHRELEGGRQTKSVLTVNREQITAAVEQIKRLPEEHLKGVRDYGAGDTPGEPGVPEEEEPEEEESEEPE